MNKHINRIKIPSQMQSVINDILTYTNTNIFLEDQDSWIAGGFARIISNCLNKTTEESYIDICHYFDELGDIDIFSNNTQKINHISKEVKDRIELEHKSFGNKFNYLMMNNISSNYYNLPYTFNYENSLIEYVRNKNLTSVESTYMNSSTIKTQIVEKFIFKDIKECFANFDMSNSKLAIKLENKDYYLYYTEDAEFYNRKNIINFERVSSPYLPSRLWKYSKKYGFNVVNDEKFRLIIKDYLYKSLSHNWPSVFNDKYCQEEMVKRLHRITRLEDHDLCLFLGMFQTDIIERQKGPYGFYTTVIGSEDWASSEIKERKS